MQTGCPVTTDAMRTHFDGIVLEHVDTLKVNAMFPGVASEPCNHSHVRYSGRYMPMTGNLACQMCNSEWNAKTGALLPPRTL